MKKNKKQRKLHSYDIAQVGLICAVFCIVCPIAFVVPISPVPVSFSLVALYLSVYLVGTRKALMGCGLYLLIGAIGIPVYAGRGCAFILSVITPITAFLITGSSIMSALPIVMVAVMAGNAIYVWTFDIMQKLWKRMFVSMVGASVVKAVLMGGSISLLILPLLGPTVGLPEKAIRTAQMTFSLTQLIAGLLGGVLLCLVWPVIKKYKNEEE